MEQELLPLEQSSCLLKEYSKLMLLVKELHELVKYFFLAKAFYVREQNGKRHNTGN